MAKSQDNCRYSNSKRTSTKRGQKKSGNAPNAKRKADSGSNHRGYQDSEDRSSFDTSSRMGSLNDLSWYSKYPTLLAAAANFPYPRRPGMSFPIADITSGAAPGTTFTARNTIPGVMAIHFIPSIGFSDSATSPASVAARELYGKIRESFSGTLPEDAPDILMYIMALDSVFSAIAAYKRLCRLVYSYSPDNYAIPESLGAAYGLTSSQVTAWKGNYTQAIGLCNELVQMTRKFTCPAVMDIFNRHYWMNDNVYCDCDSIMGQQYIFIQDYFYQLDTTGSTGTALSLVSGAWTSPSAAFNFIRGLINQLSSDEDTYTIMGHLKGAFKDVPNFYVEEIPMGERLYAVYVPEVLSQIENAVAIPINPSDLVVTQNPATNAVIFKPTANFPANLSITSVPLINIHGSAPTAADTVIASRLQAVVDESGNVYSGTEIVTGFRIHNYTSEGTSITFPSSSTYSTYVSINETWVYQLVCYLFNFDWAPIVRLYDELGKTGYALCDIYNVSSPSIEDMQMLHKVCVYSEFNSFNIM